jgi:hypothetical protein
MMHDNAATGQGIVDYHVGISSRWTLCVDIFIIKYEAASSVDLGTQALA